MLLVSLTLGHSAFSQHYFNKDYSAANDLPSNVIWDIEQDKNGIYWLLTDQGILRFDGIEWELFTESGMLPSSDFSELKMLRSGEILAAGLNSEGNIVISKFSNDAWEIRVQEELNSLYPRFLIHERANEILVYIYSVGELIIYNWNSNTKETRTVPWNRPNRIRNMTFGDKLYLLGTEDVLTFDGTAFGEPHFPAGLRDSTIYHLYVSSSADTLIAFGNSKICVKVENDEPQYISYDGPSVDFSTFYTSFQKDRNRIFYSMSSPLYTYDFTTGETTIIRDPSVPDFTVWTDFLIDRRENIWLANQRGLRKVPSLAFINFEIVYFKSNPEVTAIIPLEDGRLFLGHVDGFTVIDENYLPIWRHTFTSLSFGRVQDAFLTSEGKIIAACSEEGLLELDLENQSITRFSAVEDKTFFSAAMRGDTLIGIASQSLIYLVDGRLVKEVPIGALRKIIEIPDGTFLAIGRGGIRRLDNLEEGYTFGGRALNTYSITEFRDTLLATTASGLFYRDGDDMKYYLPEESSIQKLACYAVKEDSKGRLWLGTSHGIYLLKEKRVIRHFDSTTGLTGNEINRNAFKLMGNDRMLVGNNRGLSMINLKRLRENIATPVPDIISITTTNGSLDPMTDVTLSNEENNLDISFRALHFIHEDRLRYQYMMDGIDDEWTEVDLPEKRTAKYSFLPPGQYRFLFRVREEGGDWSRELSSGKITIEAPVYMQWWFILSALLTVIVLAWMILRYFTIRRSNMLLEKNLKKKMKESLKYQQDLKRRNEDLQRVNNELDTLVYSISHDLRAPILSAQGLINVYHITKDREERERYVAMMESNFKRLDSFIQNILEISRNSRLEVIRTDFKLSELCDEIVEMQRHREEAGQIEYEVELQEDLIHTDRGRLSIVLNNLISNAIMYRDEKKAENKIRISSRKEGEKLIISVWDNGIGIHKSMLGDVFGIFTRANDKKPGSGLGLYIARQITDKLGATISVESVYGHWTEFKVVLEEYR